MIQILLDLTQDFSQITILDRIGDFLFDFSLAWFGIYNWMRVCQKN
jgi:hypothetical protein